jgi:hypothetical protein
MGEGSKARRQDGSSGEGRKLPILGRDRLGDIISKAGGKIGHEELGRGYGQDGVEPSQHSHGCSVLTSTGPTLTEEEELGASRPAILPCACGTTGTCAGQRSLVCWGLNEASVVTVVPFRRAEGGEERDHWTRHLHGGFAKTPPQARTLNMDAASVLICRATCCPGLWDA